MKASVGTGVLAGITSATVFTAIDCTMLVFGVGGFWLSPGIVAASFFVYASLGIVLGGLAGLGWHFLGGSRRQNARSLFKWLVIVATFLSLLCFCWVYLIDYGLGQAKRGHLWHYVTAVPLSLLAAIGVWYLVKLLLFAFRHTKNAVVLATIALIVVTFVELFSVRFAKPGIIPGDKGANGVSPANPNIVLLVMDTTRRDALSCYGNPRRTTPHLDRLASEGLLFTRAYAPGAWTPPSHASMFTGLYPSQHGTFANQIVLLDGSPTIAGTLSRAGYETFFLSYKGVLRKAYGWDAGFHHGVTVNVEDKASPLYARLVKKYASTDVSPTPLTVDIAIEWLESRDSSRPFFLFVNVSDPHSPYLPRDPFFSECSRGIDLSRVDLAKIARLSRKQRNLLLYNQGKIERLNEAEMQYVRCVYDSEANYQDHHLGRLFDALRASAEERETVAIVTSDHGELLGEHRLMGHRNYLFDELIYVPLIVWGTGERGVVNNLVSLIDVFPTVMDLARADTAPDTAPEAVSLLAPLAERTLFAESWEAEVWRKAAIDDHHKYIWESWGDSTLFDLSRDPGEREDISSLTPGVAGQLHGRLAAKFDLDLDRIGDNQIDERSLKILKSLGYVE
jgi:arylsulfatase A-like enzyme